MLLTSRGIPKNCKDHLTIYLRTSCQNTMSKFFLFTVRILTVFRGLLSGIVPLHFTRRNEAKYPVNHRQNEQEILESKELCECICHQIETLTICWFKILFAYLYTYIYMFL